MSAPPHATHALRSRRVTIAPDTKVPNAMTMVVEREDHTLGNILRMWVAHHHCTISPRHFATATACRHCMSAHMSPRNTPQHHITPQLYARLTSAAACRGRQLLEDKEVLFSGYRVPHPLEPAIQVKVQTRSDNPGPVQAVHTAIDNLKSELDEFTQRFQVRLLHT